MNTYDVNALRYIQSVHNYIYAEYKYDVHLVILITWFYNFIYLLLYYTLSDIFLTDRSCSLVILS